MTPQQLGEFGEKMAADLLRQEGYDIVLSGARKHVAERGFDIIARKGSEVLIVDNKAFLSRATASTASALTTNLNRNIADALIDIRALIRGGTLSELETQAASEAIEALEKRTFARVVTGAGGLVTRVGTRLAAQGVSFRTLGVAAARIGTAVGVLLTVLDANRLSASDELTPFEKALTRQELDIYRRWGNGEDVFAGSEPF
jgi:Holliday junction resolvase-like predicted endonuclease